ncbi:MULTISPECIES: DUF421 domain-containing protein [unclassified Paracoccus (in: a-proteobacteria)]|uniref:DUF421 domain-containing protein n=1 Tax=unclassified Paracoccus (in: a-proteobacteria) TaxID=2688777 RepID=UPI0018A6C451|nr:MULTISPECIES: YetF domain-containing protein [unclassified Paracoccus (in: a-proteobacteria)]UXU73626.1 DUF421 domain-containing protein [Paracoccus sp. SMMA_5]UXU79514.1 DUF421 domain-containing protein [Paracoccus sp. SMMA_5_TC]
MAEELRRILLGQHEWLFALEILFRTTIIYFYTLMLMRWLGGRTVAQLSIVEFLLVIAIGSAVGDSLFYDDVPMLPAMLAIFLVAAYNKLLDRAILSSRLLARLFEGCARIIITDGVIDRDRLARQGIGQDELFLKLRERGITDLAQVKFAILEANGAISVLKHEDRHGEGLYHPPAIPAAEAIRAGGRA